MATAGDGMAPYESCGDSERSRKRRFPPGIKEPQNVSLEAGRNNSTGVPDQSGNYASISVTFGELEQMLKQMTFTRFETQRLKALLDSRTCDNVVEKDEASTTSGSLDNSHAAVVTSRVFEEQIASPTELAKAYKVSTIGLPKTPMASPQHPTTMENLPGELLLNIFIRLLAKQLAQMRSVSKSWNALLSQSSFVNSHLHHSINNNDQILLVFYENTSSSNPIPFTAYRSRSPYLELSTFIKIPQVTLGIIKVVGSIHGLICSCYGYSAIHIWNPSLSAVSTLPPYSFPSCDCYEICFRFGFDPKTEDYKVVKVTGLTEETETEAEDTFPDVFKKWLPIEIYSMRKGSWKLINQTFPSHITRIFDKDDVCVDGHDGRLHWVGHTNEKLDSEVIVTFDLCSETFLEMTLPDSIVDYDRSNTLGVLAGKLCVMSQDGRDGIEVWVMEEYGLAESWVKRHVFCFSHSLGGLVTGFTSHNEFLLEAKRNHLVIYDPIIDKAKVLEKSCRRNYIDKIVEYVDSLVWIAPPAR